MRIGSHCLESHSTIRYEFTGSSRSSQRSASADISEGVSENENTSRSSTMYSCSVAAVTTVMFCCTSHLSGHALGRAQAHHRVKLMSAGGGGGGDGGGGGGGGGGSEWW
jgi:hypothetical protein